MGKNEVKFGAVLAYVLIALNALYGLIIAPYLMSTIGTSEYGVYKTIGAITASVSVLDLGIGGTIQRYVAVFNSKKDNQSCSNFCAMGLVQGVFIAAAMGLVGVILYPTLETMYSETFSAQEMVLAQRLFILSMIYIVVHIFENIISGIVTGYNKFIFNNFIKTVAIFVRIFLYCVLLPIIKTALLITAVMIVIEICIIIIQLIFIRYKINLKIKFQYFDKNIFKESMLYTSFMLVQSVTVQINANVDNMIIGAVISPEAVSIYSFGLLIFSMFQQISSAISGVMLPTITDKLTNGAKMREIENIVIKTGRIQFLFLATCLCGFVIIGKDFINLWLGKGFNDVWWITLILITPAIFELSVNVCISVLRAKNKMGFRTVALMIGLIINLIITLVWTKRVGYVASALGTAVSITVASLIMMNAYYIIKIKINMFRIYFNIISRIAPILIIALIVTSAVNRFISINTWITLILRGFTFVAVEGICILSIWLYKKQRNKKKIEL